VCPDISARTSTFRVSIQDSFGFAPGSPASGGPASTRARRRACSS
jgi:hypothetical protein